MQISEIINQYPIKVSLTTQLTEVVELFQKQNIVGVVVVNDEDIVVGIIGQDDLFSKDKTLHIPTYLEFLKNSNFVSGSEKELPYAVKLLFEATASDITNQAVYFAHEDTDVATVAKILQSTNQLIVPVVSKTNKLVGEVSAKDILSQLTEGAVLPQIHSAAEERAFDNEVDFVRSDLTHRFAYVAHTRSHLWFTLTVILFAIGFILGIVFIVDPEPLMELLTHNVQTLVNLLSGQ